MTGSEKVTATFSASPLKVKTGNEEKDVYTAVSAPSGIVITEESGKQKTTAGLVSYINVLRDKDGNVTGYEVWRISSGGGTSTTSVKVTQPTGGKISVSTTNPSKGDKVIITVKPETGKKVGEVIVTDKNGKQVKVTSEGGNKYSFVMPAEKPVTVKADMVAADGKCGGTDDRPCLQFSDLTPDAWYHEAADFVIEMGMMKGNSATTFNPNGTTTRGQTVTILYRLEGEPRVSGSYSDVAAGLLHGRG